MKQIKSKLWLPPLSGTLLALSFFSQRLCFIVFIAYIPLIIYLFKYCNTKRKIIKAFFIFSLCYYVPLLYWLINLSTYISLKKISAILLMFVCSILISIIQSLYYFVIFVFMQINCKPKLYSCFTLAALFCLAEFIQQIVPAIAFPWSQSGIIIVPFTPFIQSASLFGATFISFLVLLINSLIAYIIINRHNKKTVSVCASIIAFVFISNTTYGFIKCSQKDKSPKIKVMCVQSNIGSSEKWQTSDESIFKAFENLTSENITPDTKIVVWPESAIPVDIKNNVLYQRKMAKLSASTGAIIVSGFFEVQNEKKYNVGVAFSPDGMVSMPYRKRCLVPFGETFPFNKIITTVLPFTKEIVGTDNFTSGCKAYPLDTSLGKVGCVICYESIFPYTARQTVSNGAKLITLPSNDSWFGNSAALYQHHCHARMRAVENNRFILRSSNCGITSIISPQGKIISECPVYNKSVATGEISLISKKTLYTKTGDILVLVYIFVYLYDIVKSIRFHLKKHLL